MWPGADNGFACSNIQYGSLLLTLSRGIAVALITEGLNACLDWLPKRILVVLVHNKFKTSPPAERSRIVVKANKAGSFATFVGAAS